MRAFDLMSDDDAARYELAVVGETWEGHHEPAELIARSRHRERIRFVNRYVTDADVLEEFGRADVAVLPYHRSSQSGPLQIAMANGLPVVTTAVGGLIEATAGYEGAILVQPRDPQATARGHRGRGAPALAALRRRTCLGRDGASATSRSPSRPSARLPRRAGRGADGYDLGANPEATVTVPGAAGEPAPAGCPRRPRRRRASGRSASPHRRPRCRSGP